jgi:hypothetical protein
MEPIEIDEDAIDADLRDRVGDIDLERNDAAALVWSRFLGHARRASPAFAAWMASALRELRVYAAYG